MSALVPIQVDGLARQSLAIQEMAVSSYLEQARDWLATAVERTGPESIASAKAQIATAAEATKQLGLSKEIQLDALEMVRRAEYALGKAIRRGQEEGTVLRPHEPQAPANQHGPAALPVHNRKSKVTDFATEGELSGNGNGIYTLVDGVDPNVFDEAIADAKAEGNVSRANVVRKVREKTGPTPKAADAGTTERAHQEAELINAFAAIVRRSLTAKNVSTLTPKAKRKLIGILADAIATLEGTSK